MCCDLNHNGPAQGTAAALSLPVHLSKVLFLLSFFIRVFFCHVIIKSLTPRLRSKYTHTPKKKSQKPCVWSRHWFFLTTQTWPPRRKVDLQCYIEQQQSSSPYGFDTAERYQRQICIKAKTKARLENKHLSKKNFM